MRKFIAYTGGTLTLSTAGYAAYDKQFREALPTNYDGFKRFVRTSYNVIVTAADYKFNFINKFKDLDPLQYDFDDPKLQDYKESLKQCNIRAAKRVFTVCKAHGGVYNKFAQYVSTLNHVLPKEAIDILAPLQDKAKQISGKDVVAAIKTELSKLNIAFEDLFVSFNEKAIASASLAQVHHAVILIDDKPTEVAVKIQYPKVHKLYDGDLATFNFLATVLGKVFPQLEYTWLVPEFEGNMILELNFEQEASNGERLKQMFAKDKDVYVPKPYKELTTEKLLIMEFINGWRVDDHESSLKNGIVPLNVSKTVAKVFGDMIHVHGFVHCDPHAGNLMLRKKAKEPKSWKDLSFLTLSICSIPVFSYFSVFPLALAGVLSTSFQLLRTFKKESRHELVVIDHGMYRRLEPKFRRDYCELWRALLLHDDEYGREMMKKLRILRRDEDYDLFTLSLTYTLPKRGKKTGKLTKQEIRNIRNSVEKVTLEEINLFLQGLPRDLLFVLRCSNIVRSINKSLGGSGKDRFTILGESAVKGLVLNNQRKGRVEIQEDDRYQGPFRVNLPVESEVLGKNRRLWSEWFELEKIRVYLKCIDMFSRFSRNVNEMIETAENLEQEILK